VGNRTTSQAERALGVAVQIGGILVVMTLVSTRLVEKVETKA
jgi:hypothetical protein